MDKLERMKELTKLLGEASRAYYQEAREIMSNFEYDWLYEELRALEESTGTVLAGSPTQKVGYEVLSELPKKAHVKRMLSLDKTKSPEALAAFLGSQKGLLSWKLDGLTVVLTYENGSLQEAVTRGNGDIGEIITPNAKTFINLPLQIPYRGHLVLRGEAVISYADFEKINAGLGSDEEPYKNPRNLCSGSVRQLNSAVTARRSVRLYAFSLVETDSLTFANHSEEFAWLQSQGFETVFYREVNADTVQAAVKAFSEEVEDNPIPSDGLVLLMDDIAYGRSLGTTAKFPRDSIAFKWADELAETTLTDIEWSASRTGLINPVAVFEPVELEGTEVKRASVHNVSIVEELALGAGDTVTVYKANMIIPQIRENLTRSGSFQPPRICPVCGGNTQIRDTNGVRTLYCTNPDCAAKAVKRFALFTDREGLNIEGLSEATLEKLIDRGIIRSLKDIFCLEAHKDAIVEMEGFGEKSFLNLQAAADKARNTTLPRLLTALGIANIGPANAKVLSRYFGQSLEALRRAETEELQEIPGIGSVLAESIAAFFRDPVKMAELDALLQKIRDGEAGFAARQTGSGASYIPVTVAAPSELLNFAVGHGAENKKYFAEKYPHLRIRYAADENENRICVRPG